MPRSKPDNVQVHRIELGGWERERIKRAELVAASAVLLPAVGIAIAGVGSGLAGYALYQWLKDGLFTELGDWWEQAKQDYANRPELVVYGEGFWSMLWGSITNYKGPFEPFPQSGSGSIIGQE
jgi:hypothetical protein